ncbi:hypothetical protein ACGFSI_34715 [Streptomyces virginiae]|uniref:hypothetical protein n=1 Tax=Streptomyces virginiae TaxID=1961 RepID=UPI00371D7892
MTAVATLLDASPENVEQDITEAYALVRAYEGDNTLPEQGDGDPRAEFAVLRQRAAVHRSTL